MIAQGRIDEDNGRTVGPFAGVIAEYRKHGEKAIRRALNDGRPRTKVSLYYFGVILLLGTYQ